MLTHIDEHGRPSMVDVSEKTPTARTAIAESKVLLPKEVAGEVRDGEIATKKGPVLSTAIIAGTMAVKRTSDLIPFCHPIPIDSIKFETETMAQSDGWAMIVIRCAVKNVAKTGIEMEALTGASVAALTIYDMCKALSHEIVILETRLLHKSGGKRHVGQDRV